MSVTPTAGIAAAWSAAKPSGQAVQPPPPQGLEKAGSVAEKAPAEAQKGPPAPDSQGMHVDIVV